MKRIKLVTLGGTIDAAPYSEVEGEYPVDATMTGENRALQALRDIFAAHVGEPFELSHTEVCSKDSKDVDEADRARLQREIEDAEASGCDRVIVTMGTDRMCETAKDLLARKTAYKIPVVFTGAIWPLANGAKSDGWQNLRQAAFNPASNGVYITIGELFAGAARVYKDFERRIFVEGPAQAA